MADRPDEDLSIYPYVEYKGMTFPGYPSFKEDAGKHLEDIKDFNSRDNDILLCSFPKTGTHWIHEIVSMLLDHTTEYNSRGVVIGNHLDIHKTFDHLESQSGQRIIHTHLPFSLLPSKHIENKAKIVFVNRNVKDNAVSGYTFASGLRGAPPNMTWMEFFDEHTLNGTVYSGWFNYAKEMVAAMEDKSNNIHLVLFEDMKLSPHKEIKRLAEFLEVPFDDEFIDGVAKKSLFNELKQHKIDSTVVLHPESKSTLFRKGEIGDWKNWFTVSQNEQIDAVYKQKMDGVNIKFIYDKTGVKS